MRGALLAVEQVNACGGVRGVAFEPVVVDYESDIRTATQKAAELFRDGGVTTCVGGYTSASRLAIIRAMGARDDLTLMYPTYFEGMETDPRVFYCGAVPNQFAIDYVRWVVSNLGKKIYLIGSDYVYPRALSSLIQRVLEATGATVVADRYVPLGETDFEATVRHIEERRPEVVISNIVGTASTTAFYRAYRDRGWSPDRLPIAATVTSEIDLRHMGADLGRGHFMAGSYFSSLNTPENLRYREALVARYGDGEVSHVTQVGAYNAVRALALAAERARVPSGEELRRALRTVRFDLNPEGWPLIFRDTHYTTHPSYIGRATAEGSYEIVTENPFRSPEIVPECVALF